MKFTTYGDHQEVILMIPGPLLSGACLIQIAQDLASSYKVVLITPDGALPQTMYPGARSFAQDLMYQLKIHRLTHVRMLYGMSSSCALVMELAARDDFHADYYFYESAPFYHVVPFLRQSIVARLTQVIEKVRHLERQAFREALCHDELIRKLLGRDAPFYTAMFDDMYDVAQFANCATLEHVIRDIVDYRIIEMDPSQMRQSIFFYGMEGACYKVKDVLFDKYPYANFIEIPDRYYCGELVLEPKAYVTTIKHILQNH